MLRGLAAANVNRNSFPGCQQTQLVTAGGTGVLYRAVSETRRCLLSDQAVEMRNVPWLPWRVSPLSSMFRGSREARGCIRFSLCCSAALTVFNSSP